ncbi:hypothetical protein O181_044557 [Austropuccinia psidii MF-1]|uniref:Carnitine O-acetyltransferase, mitochondrial n=1 Tax=Austropuccinia psidii MF-1 TaxID=1389203 RepID=A0A9Q3DS19_9BASI|nr:hypothetical protein [Austropuccinia psidii MF-1]
MHLSRLSTSRRAIFHRTRNSPNHLNSHHPLPPPHIIRTMSTSPLAMSKNQSSITFAHQDSLPNLPVPDLKSTAAKYFKSVLPFVSPQDPKTPSASDLHPTPAYHFTKNCVNQFLKSSLVEELQNRLELRAQSSQHDNWLSDWWNDLAYMGYRQPLIPFSSFYIAHQPDPFRKSLVKRAAGLVRGLVLFRELNESEQLEPELSRSGPLCMNSYRWLFNSCRYPQKPSDTAKKFDPNTHNHLIVIRKGKFFEFSVIKPDGTWLSEAELESQFQRVVELAGQEQDPHPIGALATEHRDTWADMRTELCQVDSNNIKSLEKIESSIICVALDDTAPITRDELAYNLWAGDGKNRFFDKHQLIVCENGQSGFYAEHSCIDGTPVTRLNEWILSGLANNKIDLGLASSSDLPSPTPVKFTLSETSKTNISQASKNYQTIMAPYTLNVLQYSGFGKRIIKEQFKTSPDAVAQLTFQLGYYKLFGCVPPTYESCQTRKFKLGRTEVIRSCSIEALEWVKEMEDVYSNWSFRLEKFRLAVQAHLTYAKWASDGQGVDRHLLGLRLCLKPGEEIPALFTDPVYQQSSNWILSTSTLPSEYFNGIGYGPVVPEGFGLSYAANQESMRYTITTTTGNGNRLKHCLEEASNDIGKMMKFGVGQNTKDSKL